MDATSSSGKKRKRNDKSLSRTHRIAGGDVDKFLGDDTSLIPNDSKEMKMKELNTESGSGKDRKRTNKNVSRGYQIRDGDVDKRKRNDKSLSRTHRIAGGDVDEFLGADTSLILNDSKEMKMKELNTASGSGKDRKRTNEYVSRGYQIRVGDVDKRKRNDKSLSRTHRIAGGDVDKFLGDDTSLILNDSKEMKMKELNTASGSGKDRKRTKHVRRRYQIIDGDVDKFLGKMFDSFIPNVPQEMKRNELIKRLEKLIKSKYRHSGVVVYGSYASGTALFWSDIDVGFKVKTPDAKQTSGEIMDLLLNNGFDNVKVEIKELNVSKKMEEVYFIWAQDRKSKIKIDCSLNNTIATFSSSFVKAVADFDISIRMFLILIKQFAECQGLNRSFRGTLPDIGHCYLGIFYLLKNNYCPRFLKEEEKYEVDDLEIEAGTYLSVAETFARPTNLTVKTLLSGYFSYYSLRHNFTSMAISLRQASLLRKSSIGWPEKGNGYYLGIIDPFNGDNIGSAVDEAGLIKIKDAFKKARKFVEKGEFNKLFWPIGKW